MACLARPSDFQGAQPYRAPIHAPAQPAPLPGRGFWQRLADGLFDARQRDADNAVGQYLARRGKLTDSIEREIAERIFSGNWGPRQ